MIAGRPVSGAGRPPATVGRSRGGKRDMATTGGDRHRRGRPTPRPGTRRGAEVRTAAATALAILLGTAAVGALVVGTTAATAGPAGAAVAHTVRIGHAPRIPAGAQVGTAVPGTQALTVDVVLRPRDPAGLAALVAGVSTPGTGTYRQYLSESAFVARFSPTPATVAGVEAALRQRGLHPGAVAANRLSIAVRTTAAQAEVAFATPLRRVHLTSGREAYANAAAPAVPVGAAPAVQGVLGLDNLSLPRPAGGRATPRPRGAVGGAVAHPRVATGGPQPCATATGVAAADGSFTNDQVAAAYGFSSLYGSGDFGGGTTVALYELQGWSKSSVAAFQACYSTSATVDTVSVDGGPLPHSGTGEADIDIEQVTSLAPQAKVLVYQGPNTNAGAYDTYAQIVADDVASVVSTSWGLCEPQEGSAAAQAESTLFAEAAVQGQTVTAAAGDQGSEDCLTSSSGDSLAVDDPASQPDVTGVGGTQWSSAGPPAVESAWNAGPTCCWGAGGGGISTLWAMPAYQSSSTVTGVHNPLSSGTPCGAASGYCRQVPDVSALAGEFPYVDDSGGWNSWGGTSLASPDWAALLALADASSSCAGKHVGLANPALYQVAASTPSAFQDITTGDNDLTGHAGGLYPATVGYDMATGLGTPDAGILVPALCQSTAPDVVSITSPGSQSTLGGIHRPAHGAGQRHGRADPQLLGPGTSGRTGHGDDRGDLGNADHPGHLGGHRRGPGSGRSVGLDHLRLDRVRGHHVAGPRLGHRRAALLLHRDHGGHPLEGHLGPQAAQGAEAGHQRGRDPYLGNTEHQGCAGLLPDDHHGPVRHGQGGGHRHPGLHPRPERLR